MLERCIVLRGHVTLLREYPGEGQPIVLLHPLSLDSRFWTSSCLEKLAYSRRPPSQPRRVITYDIRGHGRAFAAPLATSIEDIAEDLADLCALENLHVIDLVGISFGGVIAQRFMSMYPTRVRSAVLMATVYAGLPVFEERASAAENAGILSVVDGTLARWFSSDSIEADLPCVRYARTCLSVSSAEVWTNGWRLLSKINYSDLLKSVSVPVLCLVARKDNSTPPALMEALASSCQRGQLRVMTRGMHLFPMEDPDGSVEEMVEFWGKIDQINGGRAE